MNPEQQWNDLIIVGAGPAGLSAAAAAAENGLKVAVMDEFPTPGGRILGQFHEELGKGWWVGKKIAEELIEKNRKLGVSMQCGVSVHGLRKTETGWEVSTPHETLGSHYLLLATGAAEVPMPAQGWTLPGVMSIGAAQVMTNVHLVKPGERGLIIGVNVLALAIARELAVSGISLAGIVLPPRTSFSGDAANPAASFNFLLNLSHLAPSPLLRWGGQLVKGTKLLSGLASRLFPRNGVKVWDIPLKLRTAAISINGTDKVESVTIADLNHRGEIIPGSEREEPVDFVALAGGLYPLVELASVAGCPFVYSPELGGHIPLHNERLQTPVPGLYVAGNITGVESAQVAMAQGELAAVSICNDADVWGTRGKERVTSAMIHVQNVRSSALIQFHPGIGEARQKLYRMWEEAESGRTAGIL